MHLIPSIASANQLDLEGELKRLGECYDNLHVDIEDGNFIPNITFGFNTIEALRKISKKPFSVHLLVTNPEFYIDRLAKLKCSHIFVHVESKVYLSEIINKIKSFNIKAGIALNPVSNIINYRYLFNTIDAVMFMTSEPDYENQKFNVEILKNIIDLSQYKNIELWADGGIKEEHLGLLSSKQINYAVMGREIFIKENPDKFLEHYNR
ncbi:ribulose-phosphate 3-epimerase [Thermoanaerobacterium thermosaccharolyticum]|uniref:ribulose-phosphate 3-epimerase n=1 Tax=Thermoanaerobacterium thermosaccharolyticum TaxID=1517 RepID=UPI003D27BD88